MIARAVYLLLRKPFVAVARVRRALALYSQRPYYFGTLTAPAYRILSAGIMRNLHASYLLGGVIAAVQAKMSGYQGVSFIEFGVANGAGSRQLAEVADLVEKHLGLGVCVIGFDSTEGLPKLSGPEDHGEIWDHGQFAMESRDALIQEFSNRRRRLILGNIAETIKELDAPDFVKHRIGFVSVDVDLYSSTVPITDYLKSCDVARLLPAPVVYFDDIFVVWTYSKLAGEERAIEEFNQSATLRRLDLKVRNLKLYALNCLDHPIRSGAESVREKLLIVIRSSSSPFGQG